MFGSWGQVSSLLFWQLCLHVERRLKLVAVAPPLRGLKGPRGTPHKSSAALPIGGGCRAAPLTPPSLRRGFAGSKAKAAAGAAKALPAGARGLLDAVLEFGLQGFVYDSAEVAVLDPTDEEGWVRL